MSGTSIETPVALKRSLRAMSAMVLATLLLSGCSSFSSGSADDSDDTTSAPPIEEPSTTDEATRADPASEGSEEERIAYYITQLADREYTQTYGDGDNEKIWYTAAESLGAIGKPAIPHLIDALQSDDDHVVMLALYAIQLASQDPELQAQTDANYVTLPSVLNPRANTHNTAIVMSWWDEYQHLWNDVDHAQ